MATDGTPINPATQGGGQTIATEGLPSGQNIQGIKVWRGARDVDGGDVAPANPFDVTLRDPAGSGNAPGITQGRNADNQVPSAAQFQLDVASTTGILNMTSNVLGANAGAVDRARVVGPDGVTATGIPANSAQFGVPFTTTTTQVIAGAVAAQIVTVTSTANIKAGDQISIDVGLPAFEEVFVAAVPAPGQIQAVFRNAHANPATLTWFHFNVARDAASGNNIPLTGLSASMTYLFNTVANLAELERSANGELDGASGNGSAIAVEYEFNGGGPLGAGGVPTGQSYDRGRNMMGKGSLLTATVVGNVVAGVAPTLTSVVGLIPGQWIQLSPLTPRAEWVRLANAYVPGTALLTLDQPTQNAHNAGDAVQYSTFLAAGATATAFRVQTLPDGVAFEMPCFLDGATGLLGFPQAATLDGLPPGFVEVEQEGLFNGASVDRARTADGASGANPSLGRQYATTGTPLLAIPALAANGNSAAINLKTAHANWSFSVITTGAPAAWTVQPQTSVDGTNWQNAGGTITQLSASPTSTVTGQPGVQVRFVLSALAGGVAPTVAVNACAI